MENAKKKKRGKLIGDLNIRDVRDEKEGNKHGMLL